AQITAKPHRVLIPTGFAPTGSAVFPACGRETPTRDAKRAVKVCQGRMGRFFAYIFGKTKK
ncbi:hypothetical protein, partial [Cupriavidus basilensis]|uniref:hypothetical protein n=1 Tax=Cupriavidus basilensis TaxID=68895 RepID=UPI001ED8C56D